MSIIDKIIPMVNLHDGCSFHRIFNPFENMGFNFSEYKEIKNSKLVTFNRFPTIPLDQLLALRKEFGFKIVVDIDDYWHLPPNHIIFPNWSKNQIGSKIENMLKLADAVTCTTERLAEKVLPINSNVFVIPNAVPFNDSEANQFLLQNPRENEKVSFGYVAGSSHEHDLKTIKYLFSRLPHLNFTLAGYNNPQESKGITNVWDTMEKICSNNFHNPNYKRLSTKNLSAYMSHYDNIDVAIAPLENNSFNTFKSSLKAYEAGIKKCAFVASAIPPYSDDLPNDIAYFCKNNKDWVETFKLLSKNPSLVQEKGEALFEWVKQNRSLEKINELREQIFEHIINHP